MLYLGAYKQGAALPYMLYFHNEWGELADPTTPTARLRDPANPDYRDLHRLPALVDHAHGNRPYRRTA